MVRWTGPAPVRSRPFPKPPRLQFPGRHRAPQLISSVQAAGTVDRRGPGGEAFRAGMKRGSWNRFVVGLDFVALTFLALERMIGDTILGNVILIALAAMSLLVAILVGLIDLIERRTLESVVTFSVSSVLVLYILGRIYFETVPAGYGP